MIEVSGEKILVGPVEEAVGGKKLRLALSVGLFRASTTPPVPLLEVVVVTAAPDGVVDQGTSGWAEAGLANMFNDGLDAQEKLGVFVVFGVALSAAGALKMDGAEENGFAGAEPNKGLFVSGEPNPFVVGGF